MKRTRYRDRKTGRFVSKKTWKRSRSRDGTRYVRERFKPKPKRKEAEEEEIIERKPIRDLDELEEFLEESDEEEIETEFEGAFDSP